MANRFDPRRGFERGRGGRGNPGVNQGRGSSSSSGFRGGRGGDRGGRAFGRGGHGKGFSSREQGGIFLENQPAHIDTRLADDSDKALITRFRDSQSGNDSESMPLRPDFGTIGEHIKLRTNFFPVHISKEPLNEYDVAITPVAGAASRAVKRRVFQLAEQTTAWQQAGMHGTVAHDSSAKLISARLLNEPLAIKVLYYEDDQTGPPAQGGKEYTIAFTFAREINPQDLISYLNGDIQYRNFNTIPTISALNIVLAAHPLQNGIKVGQDRYFFPSAAAPADLGGGLEAWKGFYSSVRPAHRQLMVNVNVCTTAFYTPENLAVQIMPFSNSHVRMEAFCRNLRVKTTHLGHRRTVYGLASQNARQYFFQCDEFGGPISVEQYFFKKYQKRLEHPTLPLVDVGGQQNTQNYLPAEVCEILSGQPFRGELTDEHTATMIKIACQPPNVNGDAIMNNGLKELGFVNPGSTLTAFGVSIDPNMAVVPGRILPMPRLKYAGVASPNVDERASWNLQNIRFAVGATLQKWTVLLIGDGAREEFGGPQDPALRTVINSFIAMCRKSGMNVARESAVVAANISPAAKADLLRKSAIATIRETLEKLKPMPSLVLVILSNGDKAIYEGLKQLCDVELGIATVCVQVGKIRKGQPQYFANVALKVNMKMGGINHKLENDENTGRWLTSVPTMVVGMDVTHPGRGSAKGTPSIAAVVASVDAEFSQYPASLGIQKSRKEMITDLKDMMIARLRLYQKHNKETLPQRVLVYRDGVSEGQFNIVRTEELPEILKAFHIFDQPKKPYRPKLTIVICGKRHHTRFYPTEKKDAADDGNPKPGTVVDRGVTAVYDFDFFLQAHGGLHGTTRPTHYYVVHDEIGFKADDLQHLTNALSYMFARATKAVSLVSPAYYADIACERGRCYLRKLLKGGGSRAREDDVKREAEALWGSGVSDKLKDTMFYL